MTVGAAEQHRAASERESSIVRDPATDAALGEVPWLNASDVAAAVDAAAVALPAWSATTASERARLLGALHRLVAERADDLAGTISAESGKPLTEAVAEVRYANGFLERAAGEATRVCGEVLPADRAEQRIVVLRRPVGVTAAITPWNFPLAMVTRKLGPALAAGCTQVIKPAPQTPLTALAFAELVRTVGIPDGVVGLVTGPASTVVDVVFADPRVRKVTFTGSTAVGRTLVQRSSEHIVRLSLELGGHAPVLVLEHADLDVAVAETVRAKFRNAGQSCIAANRILVHRALYESFCERITAACRDLVVGPRTAPADFGPLIDDDAVAKVTRHVDDAVARGANLRTGGGTVSMGPGFTDRFFAPTVVCDVDPGMLVMNEETFGPVAAIAPFDDDEEAVREANRLAYGLAAYVFGRDLGRTLRVVEALEHGVVGVNDGVPSTPQAPFGGVKESGLGREGGHEVMREYLETKYVSLVG